MRCWHVGYYFLRALNRRRPLRGDFCGCIVAETREAAIASVMSDLSDKRAIVKVVAKLKPKGHICTETHAPAEKGCEEAQREA